MSDYDPQVDDVVVLRDAPDKPHIVVSTQTHGDWCRLQCRHIGDACFDDGTGLLEFSTRKANLLPWDDGSRATTVKAQTEPGTPLHAAVANNPAKGPPPGFATRATVLDDAARLTATDRQDAYGHPRDNFQNIADLWSTYLSDRLSVALTPRDVALMNVLTKCAREMQAPKRDNLVDIAGYARTAEMLDE